MQSMHAICAPSPRRSAKGNVMQIRRLLATWAPSPLWHCKALFSHVSVHGYLLCTDNLNMNMRMSFHSVPSSRMDQHVHHPHMGVHMRACRMRKNPPRGTRKPLCCDSPPLNQATRGTGIGPAIRPHALRVSTQPPLKMVPPSGTETSAASCPFGIIVGGHSTGKSADIG